MEKVYDVILARNPPRGRAFINRIAGALPLFLLALGTTDTAKIPSISAAGATPEITDFTPPADAELLYYGRCRCISGVPITPEGIPTPALITRSALRLAGMPSIVAVGGLRVAPSIPFINLGGLPGMDIKTGCAVKDAAEVLEKATIAGDHLTRNSDYVVVGESAPGGTTTALGVLVSMGYDAWGKVSSSMPRNPHKLKRSVVETALTSACLREGSLRNDPLKAISCVGDSMMPAAAGLILGAARNVPVIMAGGTQMAALLAIVNSLNPALAGNLAIGTTRWLIEDGTSDLIGLVSQIADIPVLAADMNFSKSRFAGLQAYERGVVKEGAGAGGSAIAAMAWSHGRITGDALLHEMEAGYESLVDLGKQGER